VYEIQNIFCKSVDICDTGWYILFIDRTFVCAKGGVVMTIDKDINNLLNVSEMQIYNRIGRGDSHLVMEKINSIMNQFIRLANYRHSSESRRIPVGLDISINYIVNSTGQGYFLTDNNISISIPYFELRDYRADSEEEKKVYRDYLFSLFGYRMLWATSIYELQNDLERLIESFNEDNKNKWSTVKRPIGYTFQQIESHIPQPALGGFTSRYEYICIVIYEEICRDRVDFLITTNQVKGVGSLEDMVWYWNDGREIGKNLDEDIKKFPEEEGLIFDEPTIIMRDPFSHDVKVIKERPFPLK